MNLSSTPYISLNIDINDESIPRVSLKGIGNQPETQSKRNYRSSSRPTSLENSEMGLEVRMGNDNFKQLVDDQLLAINGVMEIYFLSNSGQDRSCEALS